MLATLASSALLLAPIPPGEAFKLPSNRACVQARALELRVRTLDAGARWTRATVKVDGKVLKRVTRPAPGRAIRLRKLPPRTFTLTVDARTSDGRTATVRRTYAGCPQGQPKVTIPATPPPTALVAKDRIVGTGAVARKGTIAAVRYTMKAWSTGKEIDTTRGREAFRFAVDEGMVIAGFDQGVAGMRVGGRREVIIPPALAYGEEGVPPDLAPNETLVFVIDLVAVTD